MIGCSVVGPVGVVILIDQLLGVALLLLLELRFWVIFLLIE